MMWLRRKKSAVGLFVKCVERMSINKKEYIYVYDCHFILRIHRYHMNACIVKETFVKPSALSHINNNIVRRTPGGSCFLPARESK